MPKSIAFDIETVCDPLVLGGHADALAEMGSKRDQDAATFGALCPPIARPVAVGFRNPDTDGIGVVFDAGLCGPCVAIEGIKVDGYPDEAALLTETFRILDRYDRLITFAGNGYDIPVLVHRARINGVPLAAIIKRAMGAKPWETAVHIDLQHAMGFGSRQPLRAYALAYGLGDVKADGDGGDVAGLVARREAERLVRYVAGDAQATAELYRRWCE